MKRIIGFFLIFMSIVLFLYVVFNNTKAGTRTQTFSTYTFLNSTWEKYKTAFINADGRVIDYSQKGITTSEGQSYGMLRALWVGDKETFDSLWKWTKINLKRPNDHLFGWRWGKKENGAYGFSNAQDMNSAADADEDIALALILASRRWSDTTYLTDAKALLTDIWTTETASVSGYRYVIAGNWANGPQEIVINPSYFAPYAYRIFGTVDTRHDWQSLVSPGYKLLDGLGQNHLDKGNAVGLPPDWVSMSKTTGELKASAIPNLTTNYSFDAIRVPWRIGLDYQWNKSTDAAEYLQHNFTALTTYYQSNNSLAGIYAHDGSVIQKNESPAMYATAIGYLLVSDPDLAKQIYADKILGVYSNNTNSFNKDIPYYDQNWLWFGAALYNKQVSHF